jgi:alkylhydroperoxidase/carboxymuconolactone decarboxylase family protein YurZ
MTTEGGTAKAQVSEQPEISWEAALAKLREWDPGWAEQCVKMTTNPWTKGLLPTKFLELICIGLNAQNTQVNREGTRRHIRAALEAGASREEILFVMKCAAVMSIHSASFGVPILLEAASAGLLGEFGAARKKGLQKTGESTTAVEKMKALGKWNDEWDSLQFLAPVWTEEYMSLCCELYCNSVLSAKELELLLIAFEASATHMYGPEARQHIKNALKAGATVAEVMEVLKLCVVHGVRTCNLGVPILAEELDRREAGQNARR